MQKLSIVWLGALLGTGMPSLAWAYCQTHTCEFSGTQRCVVDDLTGCSSGGPIAHWGTTCISYAVHVDGSAAEGIDADQLSLVLENGFRTWSSVECLGGGTPELDATLRGTTACDQVEYNCGAEGNDNIVMFRDGPSDLSNTTIALSTIIAKLSTGEILDVDIEINSQVFDFYVDPRDARPDAHDLRLVLNHELGHFLGLSHTRVAGALMRAAYDGNDPNPTADDIAGMCRALPVTDADPMCSVPALAGEGACVGSGGSCPVVVERQEDSCSAAPGGGARHGWAGGLLSFLGLARVRRRPARARAPLPSGAR